MRFPFFPPRLERLDDYMERGQYSRALEALDAALERSPGDANLLERQAEVFLRTEDLERVVEIYRTLARHYVTLRLHARAIVFYKRILELAPDRSQLHRELATLILERRDAPQPVPGDAESQREIAASALFTLFDTEVLEEVLTLTCLHIFNDGETVLQEGDTSYGLFLLVHGQVTVTTAGPRGGAVTLDELGAGDFFGETGALFHQPRNATVTAKGTITTIELTREAFERISTKHPQVREALEDFCRQRARRTVQALNEHLQGTD